VSEARGVGAGVGLESRECVEGEEAGRVVLEEEVGDM
jgi:hypothetical protein